MGFALGIDGCREGWLVVTLNDSGHADHALFQHLSETVELLVQADAALVDMPIGLLEDGSGTRRCDSEARALLAPMRSSSVFTPPLRPALQCATRVEASELNYRLCGKRIGVQSWAISGKISEIDKLMRTDARYRAKLREAHPEVLFLGMNGGRALEESKRTKRGIRARTNLLCRVAPTAASFFEEGPSRAYRSTSASIDDILDAFALATAAKIGGVALHTLPEVPDRDAYGLPMEIAYWLPEQVPRINGGRLRVDP